MLAKGCRRGDKCPYSHPGDITVQKYVSEKQVYSFIAKGLHRAIAIIPKPGPVIALPKKVWGGAAAVAVAATPMVVPAVEFKKSDSDFPSLSDGMAERLSYVAKEYPGLDKNLKPFQAPGAVSGPTATPVAPPVNAWGRKDKNMSVAVRLKAIEIEEEARAIIAAEEKEKFLADADAAAKAHLESLAMKGPSSDPNKPISSHILNTTGGADVVYFEEDITGDDGGGEWCAPGEQTSGMVWGAGTLAHEETALLQVGCITTDYAMQNVILQCGMNLISVEGRRITRLKQWVLSCQGCKS